MNKGQNLDAPQYLETGLKTLETLVHVVARELATAAGNSDRRRDGDLEHSGARRHDLKSIPIVPLPLYHGDVGHG